MSQNQSPQDSSESTSQANANAPTSSRDDLRKPTQAGKAFGTEEGKEAWRKWTSKGWGLEDIRKEFNDKGYCIISNPCLRILMWKHGGKMNHKNLTDDAQARINKMVKSGKSRTAVEDMVLLWHDRKVEPELKRVPYEHYGPNDTSETETESDSDDEDVFEVEEDY